MKRLSLKLYCRLRLWLLGKISEKLNYRQTKKPPTTSIVMMLASGLDLRRLDSSWSLLQLIRNYANECFMNLFVTWAFSLDEALYKREGVLCPRGSSQKQKRLLPKTIINMMSGEEGLMQKLSTLNDLFEGEFIDIPKHAKEEAAYRLIKHILSQNPSRTILDTLPGYGEARKKEQEKESLYGTGEEGDDGERGEEKDVRENMFVVHRGKRGAGGGDEQEEEAIRPPRRIPVYRKKDPVLCQFIIRHTAGQVRYDARSFVSSNAQPYVLPPELKRALSKTKIPLLRCLLGKDEEGKEDSIPDTLLRTDLSMKLQQFTSTSLALGQEPPESHFVVCVNSERGEFASVAFARKEENLGDAVVSRATSFTRSHTFIPGKKFRVDGALLFDEEIASYGFKKKKTKKVKDILAAMNEEEREGEEGGLRGGEAKSSLGLIDKTEK
ncbi:iq calmodulin-binding motif domain-containing, partial [Cystoisospora suis]